LGDSTIKSPIATAQMPLRNGRDGSYTCLLTGQLLHLRALGRGRGGGLYIPDTPGLVLGGGHILIAACFLSDDGKAEVENCLERRQKFISFCRSPCVPLSGETRQETR
jgi:hypothetical protein